MTKTPSKKQGRPIKNLIKKIPATAKDIAKSMVVEKVKRWG